MSDNRIKLSGLWEKQWPNGETYFTGNMGGAQILITKNGFKDKENDPDYVFYVRSKQKQEIEDNS